MKDLIYFFYSLPQKNKPIFWLLVFVYSLIFLWIYKSINETTFNFAKFILLFTMVSSALYFFYLIGKIGGQIEIENHQIANCLKTLESATKNQEQKDNAGIQLLSFENIKKEHIQVILKNTIGSSEVNDIALERLKDLQSSDRISVNTKK